MQNFSVPPARRKDNTGNSMNGYGREIVPVRPVFDMEMLLGLLQETRLDGRVMAKLAGTWERWLSGLHSLVLDTGKSRYLAGRGDRKTSG